MTFYVGCCCCRRARAAPAAVRAVSEVELRARRRMTDRPSRASAAGSTARTTAAPASKRLQPLTGTGVVSTIAASIAVISARQLATEAATEVGISAVRAWTPKDTRASTRRALRAHVAACRLPSLHRTSTCQGAMSPAFELSAYDASPAWPHPWAPHQNWARSMCVLRSAGATPRRKRPLQSSDCGRQRRAAAPRSSRLVKTGRRFDDAMNETAS